MVGTVSTSSIELTTNEAKTKNFVQSIQENRPSNPGAQSHFCIRNPGFESRGEWTYQINIIPYKERQSRDEQLKVLTAYIKNTECRFLPKSSNLRSVAWRLHENTE
jgi:hypothetical protein